MESLKQYKGLAPQIYYLSFTRLVIEMGIMFVFPFLSLLLTKRLGYTTIQAGYIMVFISLGNMSGSLIGGKLADELGRKRTYSVLTVITMLSMFSAGFLCNSRMVIPLVFIAYTCFSAIMPAISAMIIDNSEEAKQNECFSLMYIFGNVGSAVGPIIAGFLFYRHMSWIFFSMSIFYMLTFLIVTFKVKDNYVPHKQRRSHENAKEASLISIVLRNPLLLIFVLCLSIITICYMESDYVLPLQFSYDYGLDLGSRLSSWTWTLNGAVCVFLTPFIIARVKNLNPLFNLILGCLLYAVGFGLYALTLNAAIFILAAVIWTSGEILVNNESTVFIARQAPDTHNGRVISLYEFIRGIGKCLGPLIFGYILTYRSYRFAWILIACTCTIVSIIIALLYKRSK